MECPHCRSAISDDSHFCKYCGNKIETCPPSLPLSTEESTRAGTRTEGERKHATMMFSDLSGYTAMTEKLDPEEVKDLMGRIFADAGKIIEKYEGTVERFFGDEIMALFGVPMAHEDDPVRAVRAALEIHAAVASISPEYEGRLGRPLSMHTGINTGLVITGDERIGKGRHGLTGDAINLAKRLTGLGKAGDILIGPNTHKQVDELFGFEKLEPTMIKGKSNSIQVYRLVVSNSTGMTAPPRPRLGMERRIYSAMVGRDKELKILEDIARSLTKGRGVIVNITGEAGIGKSRLIAEFKKSDFLEKVVVLEGRAISIGCQLNFYPIIDLLKSWAGIGDSDSETEAFGKLDNAINSVCSEGAADILAFVATLMGMKLIGRHADRVRGIKGESLEKLIVKHVRDLLTHAVKRRPLIIVLEDLHWADTSSIDLLESLFKLTTSHSIVFINLFRPDHMEAGNRIAAYLEKERSISSVDLVLGPLDGLTSLELIENILNKAGLPQQIIDRIVARADGNPFFIEEVVRSLIDQGALVIHGRSFQATGKLGEVHIPESITDLLMARIDRLDEQTRDLVKTASVIGRSFFYRVLSAVANTIGDIDNRLSYLESIQIIRERKRMEEIEYLFKHALAQMVAYESILKQKRRELHLKVAEAIETLFQESLNRFYGILSHHYSNAGDMDKAEKYMLKAGEEALKVSASNEALYYYRNALEVYIDNHDERVDPNEIADLEENIAVAFNNKGHFLEAVDYFDRAYVSRGGKIVKNIWIQYFNALTNIIIILCHLHLPSLRRKEAPTDACNRALSRNFDKAIALVAIDVRRCLFENLENLRIALRYDISKSPGAFKIITGGSALFSATGISISIAKRLLDYIRKHNPSDGKMISNHLYLIVEITYNYVTGSLKGELSPDSLNDMLRIGDLFSATNFLLWVGYMKIETGEFKTCEWLVAGLKMIGNEFAYADAFCDRFVLEGKLAIKRRDFLHASDMVTKGLEYVEQIGMPPRVVELIGIKLMTELYQNELDKASETMSETEKYVAVFGLNTIRVKWRSDFIIGRFLLHLILLERALTEKDKLKVKRLKKETWRCGKIALDHAKKYVAPDRTEVFKLAGRYHWLTGRRKKALNCWRHSIAGGIQMQGRVELAWAYKEIGEWLAQEPGMRLNGMTSELLLGQAEALFQEIGLDPTPV